MRIILALVLFLAIANPQIAEAANPQYTAEQYYEMGVKAEEDGYGEKARLALRWAKHVGKDGPYAKKAEVLLRTKIPKYKTPKTAELMHIKAHNAYKNGDKKTAIRLFRTVISTNPNFEWPYNNLALIYFDENKLTESRRLLRKALQINPHYVSALANMSTAFLVEGNVRQANHYIRLAAKEDPDEESVVMMKKILSAPAGTRQKLLEYYEKGRKKLHD